MSIDTTVPLDDALEATSLSSKFTCCFNNISQLRKSYPPGNDVFCDTIKDVGQFLNAKVYLQFYPCGDDREKNADPNFCSLFLFVKPLSANNNVYYAFKFTVIDASDDDLVDTYTVYDIRGGTLGIGYSKYIKLVDGHKIREQLKVQVDIKVFTERTYLRWIKVHPNLVDIDDIDVELLRKNAIQFDNQSFEDDDLGMIAVDGEQKKLFKVSKEIVCNIGNVFKTRLTSKKWAKDQDSDINGQVYKMSGYDSDLVHKFLQSIHTGILKWDSWADQLDLLEISNEYEVEWIKEEVSKLVGDSLNVENVVQSFIRSDLSDAKELRVKCLKFCDINYNQLKDTDEWKALVTKYQNLTIEVMAERLSRMVD